jgi:hypothetical protein
MRDQGAFLDISTPGGVVMARWQNRWQGQAGVTLEGQTWRYQPLEWSGLSSGGVATSTPASMTLPLLPSARGILQEASREGWRGRLRIYQWAPEDDGPAPSAEMVLIATHRGVVTLRSLTPKLLELALDSALLAPDGGRFPPRVATTQLIGVPCVLGEGA